MKAKSRTTTHLVVTILFSVIVALFLLFSSCPVNAASSLSDAERLELAERFAPVLQYVKDESCYPVQIEYYLESCSLYRVVDDSAVLVTDAPSIPQLSLLTTDDYFLNNRLGGVDDDNIIQAYEENRSQLGYTVYFQVESAGQMTYVQYWMFYVFNPSSLNRHQGDWEMVQVVLDGNMVPVATTYSQHHTGIRAQWSEVLVQDETHAKVYVALGSHANYYRYFQGKMQGLDVCGDDGLALSPSDYSLVEIRQEIPGGQPDTSWVWFGGKWGTIPDLLAEARGEAGPPGPMYREEGGMWDGATFYDNAKDLDTGLFWLEIILYYSVWIILGFVALAVVLSVRRANKMKKKGELRFPYLEILNLKDRGRRGTANLLAIAGLVVALIGLMYPVFTMEIWVVEGDYATGGFVTLFSLGGKDLFVLNTLKPNGELLNVGAVALNFGLILGAMVFLFILNNLAVRPRVASKKYIGFGLTLAVIFSVFLLAVVFMGDIVAAFAPQENAGLVELLQYVSDNPFGGSASVVNPTFGPVELRWGLDLGALLLLAGLALVVAGLVMRSVAKAEGKGR